MPETLSFTRRLRFTPLVDLLRLRLTGRLDWRGRIASAVLDAGTKQLINTTVAMTWLTRREKYEVAGDLIAHFADATDAGVSPADAQADFGDTATTARLVTRAKRRQRSVLTRLKLFARAGVFVLIGAYGFLFVRYFVGRPTVSVDYVAKLNQPMLSLPEDQRGWPIYRRVLIDGGLAQGTDLRNSIQDDDHPEVREKWLAANQGLIAKLREAAGRPSLGFVFGPGGSIDDPALYPDLSEHQPPAPELAMSVYMVDFRFTRDARLVFSLLMGDAKLASDANDGERFQADLFAALGLCEQMHHDSPTLVSALVGTAFRVAITNELNRVLFEKPTLLSDQQLTAFAHRLSGPRVAADLVTFDFERAFFLDLLQRTYTDDGHGDGRFTPTGWQVMASVGAGMAPPHEGGTTPIEAALGPVTMAAMASRQDMLTHYDKLVDGYEARLRRPLREATGSPDAPIYDMKRSAIDSLRFAPVIHLAPALQRIQWSAERVLAARDGTEIGIALELYRRRHGNWPATLAELSPGLLPTVPVDPITGGPMGYRIVDGEPLVYSVGVDRKDDGGRLPLVKGRPDNWAASGVAGYQYDNTKPIDGDWLLFHAPRNDVQ